ncbi:putative addiction module killer protein [Paraburkholderia sp. RAU2J]|uniref:type II toxin-antitoxin system RelE/ParE family toxin n=1 Tax=Paraburkholderia sp. RAU2J TaxID=1938810 RepID=UPI000F12CE2F|nr:putative addiction module killer protein [Paraburkholderia sp. RAU2J]
MGSNERGAVESRYINMIFTLASTYPQGYNYKQIGTPPVYTVNRTEVFDTWLAELADLRARAKILVRVRRAERGNFGDVRLLEEGVFEMRIDCGPGYRLYYAREGRMVYLLLCGGNKSTQQADIKHAKTMWTAIREERS